MKRYWSAALAAAVIGWSGAGVAATVKITSLGSHDGELCAQDPRADF
jgi:hypothetical protein